MPLTERKALFIMFEDLQDEKKQLKKNYREDLQAIETRLDYVLERLARLDDQEREAIDAEGVLHELAATTKEMAALIPQVSAGDVINKAAEKMAAAARENGQEIFSNNIAAAQNEVAAAAQPAIKADPGTVKRQKSIKDVIEAIEELLKESPHPLTAAKIEKELKNRYNWEWVNFNNAFWTWRNRHESNIKKTGNRYTIDKEDLEPWTKQPTTENADNSKSLN